MQVNNPDSAVEWLINVEKRAETVYRKALVLFNDDPEVYRLLHELADDEESHWRLVKGLKAGPGHVMLIPDNMKTRKATEAALSWFEHRVSSGVINKAEMIEAVAALEFSEHNDLFIYMVSALRGFPDEFTDVLQMLRAHRRRITDFLAARPEFDRAIALAKAIPSIGKDHDILLVDDEENLAILLRIFLAEEGTIDHARDGREALSMMRKKDYAVIISDIDMPVMNGIDFFLNAEKIFAGVDRRFIFLTGSFEEEYMHFFEKRRARYLFKPFSKGDIRAALHSIVSEQAAAAAPAPL